MKFWSCASLIALALFVAACASVEPSAPMSLTPTRFATPEPMRPVTATPLPLGRHAIYIVDPRNGGQTSQVLVVDPDAQRVVHGLATRYTPEIALTPDGKRLYVADSYSTRVIRGEYHDVVSVYDAATLQLLHDDVDIPGRLLYKLFPNAHAYTFLSRDGTRLFVGKYGDPDIHALRLAVLDAATFKTLAEYRYPNCRDLSPLPDGHLLCDAITEGAVRLIDPLSGALIGAMSVPIMLNAGTVLSPAGDRLYIVSDNADVTVVDLAKSSPQMVVNRAPLSGPRGSQIGFRHIALSAEGARLYVGFANGENRDRGLVDEIWTFDTHNWARVGVFKPSDPAFHFAVSAGGSQLYTVNPFKKSLAIFDTRTFQEIGTMLDLGETPALIVVPPR